MAFFFTLEQLGKETFEVESLLSFWCRLSETHGLSVNQLSTEMTFWGERHGLQFPKSLLYGRVLSMCSYGDHVQRMVNIVEAATGSRGLQAGTLLALKDVLAPSGSRALKKYKAWCPRCYQDDEKTHEVCYDRLFWAIEAIDRCPIHKLRLQTHCPHCGSSQRYPHASGIVSACHTCEEPLIGPPKSWEVALRPGYAESNISSLLAHFSKLDAQPARKNAFQEYSLYATQIRSSKLIAAEKSIKPHRKRVPPPTLQTLLKVATRDGADLVLMVIDPKESIRQSPQLANFNISLDVIRRMRTPELVVNRTREMLEKASEGDGSKSFAAHCREIGVTKGFAQYRFPELCKKVVRRWWARRAAQRWREIRKAMRLLVDSEWDRYLNGALASQDVLVAKISGHSGCSVRTARLLVAARMRGSKKGPARKGEIEMPSVRHVEYLTTVTEYAVAFEQKVPSAHSKICRLFRDGRVFTLPGVERRLPRFQFDQKGNPLPIFRLLLNHIRPGVEVDFFEWLLRPHKLLANKPPVDVLHGNSDQVLLSLVEAEFGGRSIDPIAK